jgi:hypothetical protein
MKKHHSIWMMIALIVGVGVTGWFLMPVKEEPRYQGKTVKEWFNEIPVTKTGANLWGVTLSGPHFPAIMVLRKEAVPFLLNEMRKSDSKVHNLVFSLLVRLPGVHVMDDEERAFRVFQSFAFLGAEAKDAVPELSEIVRTRKTPGMAPQILAIIEAAKKEELKRRDAIVLRYPSGLEQRFQTISGTDSNSVRKSIPMKIGQ